MHGPSQQTSGRLVSGLYAVRVELDHSLTRARQFIEQYLDSPADLSPLDGAVAELQQIRGTASIIQCFGVSVLAEEMKQSAKDLREGRVVQVEAMQEALSGAMVHLGDYIDALTVGFEDRVLVLQTAINELRLARGLTVLTEEDLFVAQMHAVGLELPAPAVLHGAATALDAQALARKYVQAYQTSLLNWLKGLNPGQNQARIGKIVEQLGGTVFESALYQLFAASAACIEALLSRGLEDAVPLRSLFGRVGLQIKALAEEGELQAAAQLGDLHYELLYFVGRSQSNGQRVAALRRHFLLDHYLPTADALNELRQRLRAPSHRLLALVADEVRADLSWVKDTIDLLVRTGGRSATDLELVRAHLMRLSSTLATLGLNSLQRIIARQADEVGSLPGDDGASTGEWMDFATSILRVERGLEDALFRQLRWPVAAEDPQDAQPSWAEKPNRSDLLEGIDAAYRESMVNLAKFKSLVDGYLKTNDATLFSEGPRLLQEVIAGFRILEAGRSAGVVGGILTHLQSPGFDGIRINIAHADCFADAVGAIEYCIEAQRAGLPEADERLAEAELLVGRLDAFEVEAAPEAIELTVEGAHTEASTIDAMSEMPEAPEPGTTDAVAAVDEVDPAIREVFLEEAAEVLQQLQRLAARWTGSEDDSATLSDIRRAFHTLKGSGRMVGATHVAEFSWAIEALLNRCCDGALEVSGPIIDVVRGALKLLPEQIEDFRLVRAESPATAEAARQLSQTAQDLASGRDDGSQELISVFRDDASERLGVLQEWLSAQDLNASEFAISPEVLRAFHTLRSAGYAVNAAHIGDLAAAMETYLESLVGAQQRLDAWGLDLVSGSVTALSEWTAQIGRAQIEVPDVGIWLQRIEGAQSAVPEGAVQATADRQLAEVFAAEGFDLVEKFEQNVKGWAQNPETDYHQRDIHSTLHTLHGAALMSDCPPIARVCAALMARVGEIGHRSRPQPEFFRRLLDVAERLYQFLDAYREGARAGDATEALALVESLRPNDTWSAPLPAVEVPVSRSAVAPPIAAPSPAARAPRSDDDEELRDIFMEEAAELLESIDQQTEALRAAPDNVSALQDLRRAFHTLKGSSRIAGLPDIGVVAFRIERTLDHASRSVAQVDAGLLAQIENAADGLLGMLADIRRGNTPDLNAVLAQLESAVEEPSADPADMAPTADSDPASVEPPFGSSSEAVLADAVKPGSVEPSPSVEFDAPAWQAESTETQEAPPLTTLTTDTDSAPGWTTDESEPQWSEDTAMPAPTGEVLDDELVGIFTAEAAELLESLDQSLEAWRANPGNEGALRELQRALHTLKGGARMTGLEAMGAAVHDMESQVAAIELSHESADDRVFQVLRAELEGIQAMHDVLAQGTPLEKPAESLAPPAATPTPQPASEPGPVAYESAAPATAGVGAVWDPMLFWTSPKAESAQAPARRETARVAVDRLDAMLNEAGEISICRSRLEEQNSVLRHTLAEVQQTIGRLREQLRMLDLETEAQIAARGLARTQENDRYDSEFDPLEMDRYSRMQELSRALAESVGDLGSLQQNLDQSLSDTEATLLQQARITTEVQTGLMNTLMVPFSRQVQRLQRIVRQTASENGRLVDVEFGGIESELDRNVLERMTAPLEHLVRNSVVHGIEPPADRINAGKPETGTISINLRREGTQLLIEVRDDGKGLDFAMIRQTAIERGLMPEDSSLSDEELAQFIFAPNFSTASKLTQDAGRGIGMDVVVSEVKQLGGSLQLDSVAGRGARFLIHLPLTLAISQALMVKVGTETYAIPLASVEGVSRIPADRIEDYLAQEGLALQYGAAQYRVYHLANFLGLPVKPDSDQKAFPVIIVRTPEGLGAERRVAVVVDQLLGNREVVSKSVGPQVSAIRGLSGATILADGSVVLILDLPALSQDRARREIAVHIAQASTVERAAEVAPLVMVVDDSITMRRVAERLLSSRGYRVITAKDGLDAMAMLQTEVPAAILLDIEMPRADGFEVAAFVRNTGAIARVPIIMITSRSGEKHRERARRLGVDRYLIKPYQEADLLSELNSVMQASDQA